MYSTCTLHCFCYHSLVWRHVVYILVIIDQDQKEINYYLINTFHTINDSLVSGLPHSMGQRQFGTVASKDIHCNERHFLSGKDV